MSEVVGQGRCADPGCVRVCEVADGATAPAHGESRPGLSVSWASSDSALRRHSDADAQASFGPVRSRSTPLGKGHCRNLSSVAKQPHDKWKGRILWPFCPLAGGAGGAGTKMESLSAADTYILMWAEWERVEWGWRRWRGHSGRGILRQVKVLTLSRGRSSNGTPPLRRRCARAPRLAFPRPAEADLASSRLPLPK